MDWFWARLEPASMKVLSVRPAEPGFYSEYGDYDSYIVMEAELSSGEKGEVYLPHVFPSLIQRGRQEGFPFTANFVVRRRRWSEVKPEGPDGHVVWRG